MKRLLSLTLSIFLCTLTMSAQGFIDHLTSKAAGQGTVTVHQDTLLDDLVNGKKQYVPEKKEERKDFPTIQTGKKMKARGYRIQVFWGGSARIDQTNAQRMGTRVTTLFPELQAYTTFESPNWRCRVGDFVTRQEAADYLNISPSQIYKMTSKHEVPVYKPNGKILFIRRDDLNHWVNKNKVMSKDELEEFATAHLQSLSTANNRRRTWR